MAHADTFAQGRAPALARARVTWRGAVAAGALPLLFLHVRFQPGFAIGIGSTSVNVELADIAVLVLAVAALSEGVSAGFAPLRAARSTWAAAVALLLWIGIESLRVDQAAHVVSAAKFAEYALLAPALVLLLRRAEDVTAVLVSVVGWSVAATTAGLLQFFGADILDAWPAGRRQPSFLGHLDFAALSGMALTVGLLWLTLRRRAAMVALTTGAIGLVVAGASAGVIGFGAAAVLLAFWARVRRVDSSRTILATVVAVAVAATGILLLRGNDFDQFLRFLGVRREEASTQTHVQTYAQHTLLAYIGWKIFTAHPIAGVGWQGSAEPEHYRPVLPAAHRRFPDVAAVAFPAPSRPYGVQNAYVQVLADLGVIGLVLWLGLFAAGIVLGVRTALRGPPAAAGVAALGAAWLVLALGLWIPQNLVAGLPLDALVWLGVGLAATAVGRA
jgi:O-Antigen ligase